MSKLNKAFSVKLLNFGLIFSIKKRHFKLILHLFHASIQNSIMPPYKTSILVYIGDYSIWMLLKSSLCKTCYNAIRSSKGIVSRHDCFTFVIDQGGMLYPSGDTIRI